MPLFSEEFLQELDDSPYVALLSICEFFFMKSSQNLLSVEESLESYALAEAIIGEHNIEYEIDLEGLPSDRGEMVNEVFRLFEHVLEKATELQKVHEDKEVLQSYRGKFQAHMSRTFIYEFTDGDLERIQTLISEMREHITKSEVFEEKHRRRLLNRLEKLQQELHKRQSDLDHFWGLVGDAGVALGKFGEDAKPLVDRIKEVTNIVWRTQSRAEELPSDSRPALLESE